MNLNTYYWRDENGVPWNSGAETDYARAVTAEMNRLAQRVQELEALIAGHDRQVDHLRLKAAAFDSSEREREALAKRVQELQRRLAAEADRAHRGETDAMKAKAAAEEWHQTAMDRAVKLRDEESKGRQYCEELAEKAEEIRALRKLADDRLAVMRRLRAAVEEALAHVEAARETSIELESDESGCKLITQELDLAREVLTAGKDHTRTTARMNTADARMLAAEAAMRFQDRVAALEGAVEQLQKLEIKRGLDAREGKA